MALLGFKGGRSRHERAADQYQAVAQKVLDLEEDFKRLSDEELKQKVVRHLGASLSDLKQQVPEIYAGVREASARTLKMRHFEVQIIGGLALLDNAICEMKTGEGKTLSATLPLTLHALTGQGCHLVTVNDYLAERDADWMRPVFEFFDLTVGTVLPGMSAEEKREAYAADITYGTNNEFGFDYLRDNMATDPSQLSLRELKYAIVDEVDSILIDESRTPLIISAPDMESTELYQRFAQLVPRLEENQHYNIDEKRKAVTLTDTGVEKIEQILGISNIYEEQGIRMVHHLEQALRAQTLFQKDKEYVVKDGQVMIVDEFTGRLMAGRRYSEGLHQALEAKEGVEVQHESRTLATITFQNFFRLYDNLAGMTGTAVTSAEEFEKVYNLEVVVVPTNQRMIREDRSDKIFISEQAKVQAVANEIKRRHEAGQPVLVGTIAIEKSEMLSALLTKEGVTHEVLNAKNHAREAEIISKAGQRDAVTISTNMAGRGTDIKLGDGVTELGGLFVLGTERHEARRIDNQLRGRAGRQGDPGESQFYVSMDDDILRVFGGDRMKKIMEGLRVPPDQPIENRLVSKSLEGAQERVEGHYFDMRKQVLSYDDVLNKQRQAIYTLRRGIMTKGVWKEAKSEEQDLHQRIQELLAEQAEQLVATHTAEGQPEQWNIEEIGEVLGAVSGVALAQIRAELETARNEGTREGPEVTRAALGRVATEILTARLAAREQELGAENLKQLERSASLRAVDTHWMEHLDTMDYLRTGIGLRGYGQRDPLVEYQKEGFQLFQKLLATIKATVVEVVFKAQAVKTEQEQGVASHPVAASATTSGQQKSGATTAQGAVAKTDSSGQLHNPDKQVGRNDPCPCGSGKKFKKCGMIDAPEHTR